eukprot:Sdes_comp23086_c0_seq1m21411
MSESEKTSSQPMNQNTNALISTKTSPVNSLDWESILLGSASAAFLGGIFLGLKISKRFKQDIKVSPDIQNNLTLFAFKSLGVATLLCGSGFFSTVLIGKLCFGITNMKHFSEKIRGLFGTQNSIQNYSEDFPSTENLQP